MKLSEAEIETLKEKHGDDFNFCVMLAQYLALRAVANAAEKLMTDCDCVKEQINYRNECQCLHWKRQNLKKALADLAK